MAAIAEAMDRKKHVGDFFCLLDIAAFMHVDLFKRWVHKMTDEIKAWRRTPGVDEILVPGSPPTDGLLLRCPITSNLPYRPVFIVAVPIGQIPHTICRQRMIFPPRTLSAAL